MEGRGKGPEKLTRGWGQQRRAVESVRGDGAGERREGERAFASRAHKRIGRRGRRERREWARCCRELTITRSTRSEAHGRTDGDAEHCIRVSSQHVAWVSCEVLHPPRDLIAQKGPLGNRRNSGAGTFLNLLPPILASPPPPLSSTLPPLPCPPPCMSPLSG